MLTWNSDAMTKYSIQVLYERTQTYDPLPANETIDFNDYSTWEMSSGDVELGAEIESYLTLPGLYREFTGFQFRLDGGGAANIGSQSPYLTEHVPFSNATFQLDSTIPINNSDSFYASWLDTVPYNSTLWLNNGTSKALSAPFLNLSSGCGTWMYDTGSILDVCLCYQGKPLTSDFRTADALTCISEDGYVWGFAGVITLVGILLEVCWVLGCFGIWLDMHINSTLFRMNRRSSGTVRNILDIAEAIQRELGRNTGAYAESELKEALKRCAPVGYEIQAGHGKVDRISTVPIVGLKQRRNGLILVPGKLYA